MYNKRMKNERVIGDNMKGSIRIAIGFLLVFGAVGGMDSGPDDMLYYQIVSAVIGLFIMSSGAKAMNRYE